MEQNRTEIESFCDEEYKYISYYITYICTIVYLYNKNIIKIIKISIKKQQKYILTI